MIRRWLRKQLGWFNLQSWFFYPCLLPGGNHQWVEMTTPMNHRIRKCGICTLTEPLETDEERQERLWAEYWDATLEEALRQVLYGGFDNFADYEKYGDMFIEIRQDVEVPIPLTKLNIDLLKEADSCEHGLIGCVMKDPHDEEWCHCLGGRPIALDPLLCPPKKDDDDGNDSD